MSDVGIEPECENILRSGDAVPEGFGAAYDPLDPDEPLLIRATGCYDPNVVAIGRGSENQYIYRLGYEWRNDQWNPVALNGANFVEDWIVGSANAVLPRSAAEIDTTNYFVAYMCTWTGREWKCGCADSQCAEAFWQLQAFKRQARP